MTRNEFLVAMGEYLSLFDYPLTSVLAGDSVMDLGDEGLSGIITAFRATLGCEENLPKSPFAVPGGEVTFSLEANENEETIVLTLEAMPDP